MRRKVILENQYITLIVNIDDLNMCTTETRNGTQLITIDELVNNFSKIPVVQTYGILSSYIINLDTNEKVYFRTYWDDILESKNKIINDQIMTQIENLSNKLK